MLSGELGICGQWWVSANCTAIGVSCREEHVCSCNELYLSSGGGWNSRRRAASPERFTNNRQASVADTHPVGTRPPSSGPSKNTPRIARISESEGLAGLVFWG